MGYLLVTWHCVNHFIGDNLDLLCGIPLSQEGITGRWQFHHLSIQKSSLQDQIFKLVSQSNIRSKYLELKVTHGHNLVDVRSSNNTQTLWRLTWLQTITDHKTVIDKTDLNKLWWLCLHPHLWGLCTHLHVAHALKTLFNIVEAP